VVTTRAGFRVGDVVELVRAVPGQPRLQGGRRGRLLWVGEGEATVQLQSLGRPWLLPIRYLRLLERAAVTGGA